MIEPVSIAYHELLEQIPAQDVRVQLNWTALAIGIQSGVVEVSLDNAPEWNPKALYAPWYKDAVGAPASYDAIGARPWRYDELIAPRPRQQFDYSLPTDGVFSNIAAAQEAKILTLDVAGGEQLVLDGNHRLMLRLGYLASYDIAMTQYRIQAPLELQLVPDVMHWLEPKAAHPRQP